MALSRIDTTNMIEDVPQSKLDNNINFRNLIINGDMSIAQRGTSQASISSGTSYYTIDRYKTQVVNAGTWTQSQSTDVPSGQGFGYSLKMDCTTADTSLGADDFLVVQQVAEAQNLQYLKYGTSNAESITMSFWVKSNKTGTYSIWLFADDNNKTISAPYTISSADTWEKKTITFVGDTISSITNDNDQGIRVYFVLAAGSNWTSGTTPTTWQSDSKSIRAPEQTVNLADSTDNEWYITGVQLEAGTTASDFEFLPFDINYQRCKRYYQKTYDYGTAPGTGIENGWSWYGTDYNVSITSTFQSQGIKFETQMRSSPSLTLYDGQGNSGKCTRYRVGSGPTHNESSSADLITTTNFRHFGQGTSGTGNIAFHYEANAEL